MAGHTSVSVVLDRYGHLYPQGDDELIRRLEARAGFGTTGEPVSALVVVSSPVPASGREPRGSTSPTATVPGGRWCTAVGESTS